MSEQIKKIPIPTPLVKTREIIKGGHVVIVFPRELLIAAESAASTADGFPQLYSIHLEDLNCIKNPANNQLFASADSDSNAPMVRYKENKIPSTRFFMSPFSDYYCITRISGPYGPIKF